MRLQGATLIKPNVPISGIRLSIGFITGRTATWIDLSNAA
jgi:hypothetical protein